MKIDFHRSKARIVICCCFNGKIGKPTTGDSRILCLPFFRNWGLEEYLIHIYFRPKLTQSLRLAFLAWANITSLPTSILSLSFLETCSPFSLSHWPPPALTYLGSRSWLEPSIGAKVRSTSLPLNISKGGDLDSLCHILFAINQLHSLL